MKAGIVIHSHSGHTVSFARSISQFLEKEGHSSEIHLLRTKTMVKPGDKKIELRKIPDSSEYDILLVGAPVWAFNASPVIMAYLKTVESLKNKQACAFVTHGLPFPFVAKKALRRMESKLEALGAEIIEGGALHWLFKPKTEKIEAAAAAIVARIKGTATSQ